MTENREHDLLFIREAGADTPAAARSLLAGLAREALRRGLKEVRLATPPDHLLTRVAVLSGAEQRITPAKHGMVAVTDWTPLLPEGFTMEAEGLCLNERLLVAAPPARLVELAFGYRSADDLLLTDEVRLVGAESDLEYLRQAFPVRFPRWSLAPFWG